MTGCTAEVKITVVWICKKTFKQNVGSKQTTESYVHEGYAYMKMVILLQLRGGIKNEI